MNRICLRRVAFLLVLVAFVSKSAKATGQTSDFSGLVLEVTTTKDAFVQLEPVPLALTLTNKTNQTILGHNALEFSLGFTDLFVYHHGEGRKIVNLSPIRGSATVKPRQMQSRESYGSRELLVLDLDKVFREPGYYEIQAVVHDVEWKEEVRSNRLRFRIVAPSSIDLQGSEFLKANTNPSHFFSGLEPANERTQDVLKMFVSNFRESSYGDYAAFMLGEFYFVRKDYTRAIEQLNNVSKKPDFVYGDRVLYYLVEANARLGNRQQAGHHLDSLRASNPDSNYLERAEISMSRETKTR